jgi:hypothetical protein
MIPVLQRTENSYIEWLQHMRSVWWKEPNSNPCNLNHKKFKYKYACILDEISNIYSTISNATIIYRLVNLEKPRMWHNCIMPNFSVNRLYFLLHFL